MQVVLSECFRPGDIVRASVLSLGDARSYYLSTAENELGVVYAKSIAGKQASSSASREAFTLAVAVHELAGWWGTGHSGLPKGVNCRVGYGFNAVGLQAMCIQHSTAGLHVFKLTELPSYL